MIRCEGISCRYGMAAPIFEEQSFAIPECSITMLLGANGSGKTTLLKCLTKQLHPYAGQISIKGIAIDDISHKGLAKLMAYVPQGLDRNVDYTVLDFIAFGRTPHLGLLDTPTKNDYEIARSFADQNGILHLCEQALNAISGGERQLVYIARALVQDTPIIIMDEPMSALDFMNQARILKIISNLARSGKTVLLTSHNPNHALSISSNVLLIDQNRNILWGKAEELLTDERVLLQTFGNQVQCIKTKQHNYITFIV